MTFPYKSEVPIGGAEAELWKTAQDAVRTLIRIGGDDPDRPGMLETPRRVVEAFMEATGGYGVDVSKVIQLFDEPCEDMVVVTGVRFNSTCEHHLMPFFGTASVGYVPSGKVIGLSKLPRVVEVFARRFQVQERLTRQVADAVYEASEPRGVGVVMRAEHTCMSCRGVRKTGDTVTSSMLGVFRDDPKVRAEFLALIREG